MAIIHALHHQTEELLGELSNTGATDKYFRLCEITQDLNGELVSNFWMPATIEESVFFEERALYILKDEDEKYMEFIIFQSETDGDEKQVFGVASYTDMNKKKIINPEVFTNKNLVEYSEIIFPGTLWQMGVNETTNFKSVTLEAHEGAYSFLVRVAKAFEVELKFRIETSGSRVIGRYVDFVQRVGRDTQKEIEWGKDLIGVRKIVHSERIVSALLCIGPQQEDGTRLTSLVTDEDAFQRWNVGGQHIIDIYEPESSQTGMTLAQLNQYGRTELNKRISSVIEYIVDAEVIEGKEPHEKTRIGDRIRVKNPEFTPALYADARVISSTWMLDEEEKKTYNIGEVVTYTEDEIFKVFRTLQDIYGTRVVKGPTAPAGSFNVIWIKTGGLTDVAYTWDGEAWNKIAPTTAIEIGAATPEDVAEQIDAIEIGARNLLIVEDIQQSFYLGSDGTLKPNAESFTSGPIVVARMDSVTASTKGRNKYKQFAFYNASGVFMPPLIEDNREEVTFLTAAIPVGAEIVRFSSDDWADGFFKVEKGGKVTDWTPSPEDVEVMAQAKATAAETSAKAFATTEIQAATVANEAFVQDYAQSRIAQNDIAPQFPLIGDMWIDTSSGSPVWKKWDGSTWTLASIVSLTELSGMIAADQLGDDAVTARSIAAESITSQMIVAAGLDAQVIKFGTMSGDRIAANSIKADRLVAGSITGEMISGGTIDGVTIRSGFGTNKSITLAAGAATFVETFTSGANTITNTTRTNDNGLTLESVTNGVSSGGASVYQDGFITNSFQTVEATMINPGDIKMNFGLSHFLSVAPNSLQLGGTTSKSYIDSRLGLDISANQLTFAMGTDVLRYNGNPVGLSSAAALWSGVVWMTAAHTVTPSRKMSDCPNGWVLIWSRFTSGAAVDTDWNQTFIHKSQADITTNGLWADLIATGADATRVRAAKYIYPKDDRIIGHASNGTGSESGQVLRYVFPF